MNLTNIWGSFSYLSALFIAVYIVAMKLPRKKTVSVSSALLYRRGHPLQMLF